MISFFASLSAKPLNGATPSYSSVQGTWIQKYGDVIYVFGDADLGPCKVTNFGGWLTFVVFLPHVADQGATKKT